MPLVFQTLNCQLGHRSKVQEQQTKHKEQRRIRACHDLLLVKHLRRKLNGKRK